MSIAYYDEDDLCAPIIDDLLFRLDNFGMRLHDFGSGYIGGRWVNKEGIRGTIYISTTEGINWDEGGVVDERQLRRTLTEEGIHAWFDTDVDHGSNEPQYKRDAMETMRVACGHGKF